MKSRQKQRKEGERMVWKDVQDQGSAWVRVERKRGMSTLGFKFFRHRVLFPFSFRKVGT